MRKKTLIVLVILIALVGLFVYLNEPKPSQVEVSERGAVETYLRDNIKTIAPNDPVLGGSWYIVSLSVDEAANSGEAVYEDGHIQSKATFKYEFEPKEGKVEIKDFKVK